jgi:hypothetical protein
MKDKFKAFEDVDNVKLRGGADEVLDKDGDDPMNLITPNFEEINEVGEVLDRAGDDPMNLITPTKPKGNFLMKPDGEDEWTL